MMLEKSVIFVSDNIPLLSSAILGMQCFLAPFKWTYVQIPILPRSLVDMIEAPMPFIVGLLKSHFQFVHCLNNPTNEDGMERLVVHLNGNIKEVTLDTRQITMTLPVFKSPKDKQTIHDRILLPFSVLNCSQSYIYQPSNK